MSKTKSKREYVVGYKGDNQCVYGPDGIVTTSCTRWVDRMTTGDGKEASRTVAFSRCRCLHLPPRTRGHGPR